MEECLNVCEAMYKARFADHSVDRQARWGIANLSSVALTGRRGLGQEEASGEGGSTRIRGGMSGRRSRKQRK
ncbi:hypothetical protein CDL15_Pgr016741 [Punica granatum]|uniref:Uncharacterized protein n=1 Tax=Punica granatum TaxID=22663 RepID=A0A218WXA7_PUNGR|nr:hypothetical protein CDL15_Pgr016741 [Punica granatum]